MSTSPKLGLLLTTATDNPTFKSWRTGLMGDASTSNMMLIDSAVGEVQDTLASLIIWASSEPAEQEDGCVWNEILP